MASFCWERSETPMNALTQFTDWIVRMLDVPLGWLLNWPRDATLLVFALLTALLMTVARRYVTNQDRLRSCSADLRQLKRLARDAKQSDDKPRRQRLRNTAAMIKPMQLAEDLKVLAAVLLPVAALALWAVERLDYLPPRVNDELTVRAFLPISSVDSVAHLVPMNGVELQSSAIQVVTADQQSPPVGVVQWKLRPTSATNELALTIRHRGESAVHRVAIGRRTYLPPQQVHQNERLTQTEVELVRYRPLRVPLKSEGIGLPPWMVGYLCLTLLLVPMMKRCLRVF